MPDFAQRRDKLRKLLVGNDKLPRAMLVTNYTNVTYLTGFTGDSSYLLLTPNEATIISDGRYTEQLERECPDLKAEIRSTGETQLEFLTKVLNRQKHAAMAIEADSMTVSLFNGLKDKVPKIEFVPSSGQVEQLREIKDKDEVAEIRAAVTIAEKAFAVVKASLRPSQTEKEIADEIDHQIRLFGGRGSAFPAIVGVGPNAALPHYRPGDVKLEESAAVLIDWGARGRQYVSDLTRVLVTSRIPPKLERIYGVTLKAQLQAIAKIKPGAILKDVDAAARDVITKAGFGKEFGHSLGHGIGLEVHESPRLAVNQDRPLKAGMVVTVEPGIYLPGFGGVRIEDDVLVTKNGHEVLTSVPKDLADCVIG